MNNANRDDISNQLLKALHSNQRALTITDLRQCIPLKLGHATIRRALQHLESEGRIQIVNGRRYQISSPAALEPPKPTNRSNPISHNDINQDANNLIPPSQLLERNRWHEFRQLCRYYAECLRIEASAKIRAYGSEENAHFACLQALPNWDSFERGNLVSIESHHEWAAFRRYIARQGGDAAVFIGGPIWCHIGKKREDNEIFHEVMPVFFRPIQISFSGNRMEFSAIERWEINYGWLEKRFRQAQDRLALLTLVGLVTEDDHGNINKKNSLFKLSDALFNNYREWWQEPCNMARPSVAPSIEELEASGLYNRIALFAQSKLKYTWRLHKELSQLADTVSDSDLDQSALQYLFPHICSAKSSKNKNMHTHHDGNAKYSITEINTLNPEQRKACEAALTSDICVIKGPPGTGKSRVVSQVLAQGALCQTPMLFASRNHKAIEAVVPHLNASTEPYPLVLNLAVRYGQQGANAGTASMLQAISDVIGQPKPTNAEEIAQQAQLNLAEKVNHLSELRNQFDLIVEKNKALQEIINSLSQKSDLLPEHDRDVLWNMANPLSSERQIPSHEQIQTLTEQCLDISKTPLGWKHIFQPIMLWWYNRRIKPSAIKLSNAVASIFEHPTLSNQATFHDIAQTLKRYQLYIIAMHSAFQIRHLRLETKDLPTWGTMLGQIQTVGQALVEQARTSLLASAKAFGSNLQGADRQALAEVSAELGSLPTPIPESHARRLSKMLREHMRSVLRHLPLWSSVNLSVGRDFPLEPALFDLLIIDEAGQCDIPSVIPLMFRAKRVTAVGDPMQLSHIASISKDVHYQIRTKYGLTDTKFSRFLHLSNSFINLVETSQNTKQIIQLRDHHRSHPAIAEYSNKAFYREQLNVFTETSHLQAPLDKNCKKTRMGIEWTDLADDTVAARPTGSISQNQIDAIAQEILRLRNANFRGTVGVVTPFRSQANRIRDAVMKACDSNLPSHWQFESQTADGFQGGERDVMLFSLVGGANMPNGSFGFLQGQPNRFNVAVSRARGLLHVFGNLQWALTSGIGHIETLADMFKSQEEPQNLNSSSGYRKDLVGPVWEPKFGIALQEAGLPIQRQYPVLGKYYLDFAIVTEHGKIAIEVDGESWHRDAMGNRKVEDARRDMVLSAAGWRVHRFWVYEIREDINRCVDQISKAWSTLQRKDK